MSVLMETTTVPLLWSHRPAYWDECTLVLDFSEARPPTPHPSPEATVFRASAFDADVRRRLDEIVAGLAVGARLGIIGPEPTVGAAIAWALDTGFEDAEIKAYVSGDDALTTADERIVVCAHCHGHTSAHFCVAERVSCANCSRELMVHHHYSMRAGGYLGYRADAEAPT